MKNGKRWLALTAALCMAMPSMTAFAAPGDPGESVGTGNVEYDPKVVAPYYNVVLPTINDGTYDFVMDPYQELPKYDSETYNTPKTVYFSQTTPAQLQNAEKSLATGATSDKELYVLKYDNTTTNGTDASGSPDAANLTTIAGKLKTEFVTSGGINTSKTTSNLYVWVPDTSATVAPEGKFVMLTKDNVLDYCTAFDSNNKAIAKPSTGTISSGIDSLKFNVKYNSGDFVFDNVLYEAGYVDLATTTYDISEYVSVNSSTGAISFDATKKTLYVTKDNGTSYDAVTSADFGTYVELVEATTTKTNVSDVVKIVNKSSADTTVTATVTVENAGSLKFVEAANLAGADANVNMQVLEKHGNASTTTPKDVKLNTTNNKIEAVVSFDLAGKSDVADYNTYQGDIIDATGGHEYVRYNKPTMAYDTAEFSIQADTAPGTATNKDAWAAYVEELKDAYVPGTGGQPGTPQRTKIEVVYTLQNDVNDDLNGPSEINVGTFNWAGTGADLTLWFAINATGNGGFTDSAKLTSISVKKGDGTYYTSTSAADLAKVTFVSGGNADGWAGIKWTDLASFGITSFDEMKLTYDGQIYVVK